MAYYLLTEGDYSDYTVRDLLTGPDGLDVEALRAEFREVWDHGGEAVQAACYALSRAWADARFQGLGTRPPIHTRPCEHTAQAEQIRAWRAAQGWTGYDYSGDFVQWLVAEHGCAVVEFIEVHA